MSSLDQIERACRLGDLDSLQATMQQNPWILLKFDQEPFCSLLPRSIMCGHTDIVEFLLKQGFNPNIQTKQGDSPLHIAVGNKQYKVVKLLLKSNADVNIQQNGNFKSDGDTPLHHAVMSGDSKMVKILLKAGASPNITNLVFGRTPLHVAVDYNQNDIVKLLLEYNACVTIQDRSNKRPADLATDNELKPVLESYEFRINTNSILQDNNEIDDIPPIPDKSFENLSLSARTSRSHSRSNSDNWTMNSRTHSRNNSANVSIDISQLDSQIRELESMNMRIREKVKASIEAMNNYTIDVTQEPDAEKTTNSVRLSNIQSNNFSFGSYREKGAQLLQWLSGVKLESVFEILMEAGYDDIEHMLVQIRSKIPITNSMLQGIGIEKPGQRYRLLAALEEESGQIKRSRIGREEKPSFLKWCSNPIPNTNNLLGVPTLKQWLDNLELGNLDFKFIDSGFEDLEHNFALMNSHYPITDDILKNDILINQPGYRQRILQKLFEDSRGFYTFRRAYNGPASARGQNPEILIEKEGKLEPCKPCIMF